ncbi:lysophospholipid acyltransferase family protein [Sulfurovum sp.]|uniref:lysophospholipid acyltransferase family protein n=1 Tax=Sulfurovum sp. TaxID=1969726 RepID=UPI0035670E83
MKKIFFLIIIKPIILIIAGVNVRGIKDLPVTGPCIVAANHNSHIDTLALMSLFPINGIDKIRPVAAADYFLKNRFSAWFFLNLIGIIPISRKPDKSEGHPFDKVRKALENNEIIIIFPEGSRGESEQMGRFKTGVAHLAKSFPEVPVLPIHIHGAGKCLPKGEALFVPFIIDIFVGKSIYHQETNVKEFTSLLEEEIKILKGKQ